MAEYSIGEVERLTGLKAHVLRYWEEAIPFVRPRKDDQGRRFYSARDVELISRIKYLVQEKKYTLEGAGERLVAELTDARMIRTRETVESVRAELANIYTILRKRKEED
jgi:DNA-binding transcriptional MerR regulator